VREPWLELLALENDPSPQSIVEDHGPSLSGSLNDTSDSAYKTPTSTV